MNEQAMGFGLASVKREGTTECCMTGQVWETKQEEFNAFFNNKDFRFGTRWLKPMFREVMFEAWSERGRHCD